MKRIIAGVILSLVTIILTQSAVITIANPFLGLLQLITGRGKNPASAGEMNTYLLMTRGQKWHSAQST